MQGGGTSTHRRISYLTKLIDDEDIPFEELHALSHFQNFGDINLQACRNSKNSFGNMIANNQKSEFQSDAYLEYRRRVFEQLAAEYDKGKTNQTEHQHSEAVENPSDTCSDVGSFYTSANEYNNHIDGNLKCFNELIKSSSDLQPSWDDSDLKSETYITSTSPNYDITSSPILWQKSHNSQVIKSDISLNDGSHNKCTDDMHDRNNPQALMNWTSFDEQIKRKAMKTKSRESVKTLSNNKEVLNSPRRSNSSSFQKQKMEREAIRQKLSMENGEEFKFGSDRSWNHPRIERSYSANNHSLQICYINESCSSDGSEDEDVNVMKNHKIDSPKSGLFSPGFTLGFASRRYGNRYLRQNHLSDDSSQSSSTSSLTMSSPSLGTESMIVRNSSYQESPSSRSKQEEMEMEARFQLAQAHQRAKIQAEKDRQQNRSEKKSSLVHRLLSVTLPDDITGKIKTYSLMKHDCCSMTLGQLQLILNDMHAKKQSLNEELMKLLLTRDELQIEQDAKLMDVEDAKAMMLSIGPETTV